MLFRSPLVPILFGSQALNAVLLLPLLVFMFGIVRDRELMGEHAMGPGGALAAGITIAVLAVCVIALAVLTVL